MRKSTDINKQMTTEELIELRNDHKKTGERLASIETLLGSIKESLSDFKNMDKRFLDALNEKANVKEVDDLKEKVESIETWKHEKDGEEKAQKRRLTIWGVVIIGLEVVIAAGAFFLSHFIISG